MICVLTVSHFVFQLAFSRGVVRFELIGLCIGNRPFLKTPPLSTLTQTQLSAVTLASNRKNLTVAFYHLRIIVRGTAGSPLVSDVPFPSFRIGDHLNGLMFVNVMNNDSLVIEKITHSFGVGSDSHTVTSHVTTLTLSDQITK